MVHLSMKNAQLSNKQAQLSKDNAQLSQEKAQMSQEKTSILMELSDCKKYTDNERRTNTQLKSSNEVCATMCVHTSYLGILISLIDQLCYH